VSVTSATPAREWPPNGDFWLQTLSVSTRPRRSETAGSTPKIVKNYPKTALSASVQGYVSPKGSKAGVLEAESV